MTRPFRDSKQAQQPMKTFLDRQRAIAKRHAKLIELIGYETRRKYPRPVINLTESREKHQ